PSPPSTTLFPYTTHFRSHDGKFFHLKDAESEPKPHGGRLPIVNAGSSAQGRSFAAKHSDFVFTIIPDVETGRAIVEATQQLARRSEEHTSELQSRFDIVCRETRDEVDEYME